MTAPISFNVFTVPPQESWFARSTQHHVRLPRELVDVVRVWMAQNGVTARSSIQIDIFADEVPAKHGALNFDSAHLTGVSALFRALSIRENSAENPPLIARLSFTSKRPQIWFWRQRAGQHDTSTPAEPFPLLPFSEKSEVPHMVETKAASQVRGGDHERLLNRFSRFLINIGHEPAYSKSIDLVLMSPPLIVEAKAVANKKWTHPVREAVAQLREYQWFYEELRNAALLFLASEAVPGQWRTYLRECHNIWSAWPEGDSFFVENLDEILPLVQRQKKKFVFLLPDVKP